MDETNDMSAEDGYVVMDMCGPVVPTGAPLLPWAVTAGIVLALAFALAVL